MSIQEIFIRDGEEFFREREAQVILRLMKGSPTILSTGGGAFIQRANRQAINLLGVSLRARYSVGSFKILDNCQGNLTSSIARLWKINQY